MDTLTNILLLGITLAVMVLLVGLLFDQWMARRKSKYVAALLRRYDD